MAELKQLDEEEKEQVKYRNIKFDHFPLKQFADVGKVENKGDPHLKEAVETELYEFEKRVCNDEFQNNYEQIEDSTKQNSKSRATCQQNKRVRLERQYYYMKKL